MNSKDYKKAAYEQTIFGEFAAAASLSISPGSILNERPPLPDVSCKISEVCHYFELTEIVDADLARNRSISLKTRRTNGGPYSDDDPLLKAFLSKASKAKSRYETLRANLELVAYYDKQRPPIGLQSITKLHLYWIAQDMLLFGPSTRLWIFDARTQTVLLAVAFYFIVLNKIIQSSINLELGARVLLLDEKMEKRLSLDSHAQT